MLFSIPIEMCEYVIRTKCYRPMQLYIYLKSQCSGKIKAKFLDYKSVAMALGLFSERAIKNNIALLLRMNWIGYNKKTGIYFVRGFDAVRRIHDFRARTAAEFHISDIKKLKAFLAGAKITHLVNVQRKRKRAAESKNGGSNQTARQSSTYYPVANKALSLMLGVSISNAFLLKKMAGKARYIEVKKSFVKTGLKPDHKRPMKIGGPEVGAKVRIVNYEVVFQDVDMVAGNVRLKCRKKLETYIMGGIGGK